MAIFLVYTCAKAFKKLFIYFFHINERYYTYVLGGSAENLTITVISGKPHNYCKALYRLYVKNLETVYKNNSG